MWFCNHEWEKMSDTTVRALPEELISRLTKVNGMGDVFLKTKHVVILACKKCGKIYKSVETLGGPD